LVSTQWGAIAERDDRMLERHFVAYGVRIGLRVDCRALLDTLDQDPERMHLPFGWRAVEDHEPDAPVSVRYELLTGGAGGAWPSYRIYAGTNLVAEVGRLTDVGCALAAHAESFVAERAPEHLFVHAGVVGFRPGGAVPLHHHHLQEMAKPLEGATVTIELHHELLARTPLVDPLDYDDLIHRSQSFEWGGMTYRTLGREDMLWHVYAHAFVVYTLRPGAIRLLSVADLAHATEAWIDQIDWARLRRQYGRLLRALHVLHDLVPWSPHVVEVLREQVRRPATAVRADPIDSDPDWSVALIPDVIWPPEWWFRMRYGITTRPRWVWFRVVGHPARLALCAARAVMTRLPR